MCCRYDQRIRNDSRPLYLPPVAVLKARLGATSWRVISTVFHAKVRCFAMIPPQATEKSELENKQKKDSPRYYLFSRAGCRIATTSSLAWRPDSPRLEISGEQWAEGLERNECRILRRRARLKRDIAAACCRIVGGHRGALWHPANCWIGRRAGLRHNCDGVLSESGLFIRKGKKG